MATRMVSGAGILLAILLLSWSHTAFGIRGLPFNETAFRNATIGSNNTVAPAEKELKQVGTGTGTGTSVYDELKSAVERVVESDASRVEETQAQTVPVSFSGLGCHGVFISQEHAWMCAGRSAV